MYAEEVGVEDGGEDGLLDDDFREDGKGFRGEVEVVMEEHEPRWSRLAWLPVDIEESLQKRV